MKAALPLVAALALGGCAGDGSFPSLAPRPEESAPLTEPPPPAPAEVARDPALAGRLAVLQAEAQAGGRAFDEAFPGARAAVAAAGARDSESWVMAQQALSRLEAARVRTTTALAELDRIALERADRPANGEDSAALGAATAAVQALATDQQGRIDGLRARLSGG